MKREEVIRRGKICHGNKFDYKDVPDEVDTGSRILLLCNGCGRQFKQIVSEHIRGTGCAKCSKEEYWRKNREGRKRAFLEKSKEKHSDKYDYSKVDFINYQKKVEIICPLHGSFFVTPNSHCGNSTGCPECGRKKSAESRRKFDKGKFIEKVEYHHNGKYTYHDLSDLRTGAKIKVSCNACHRDFLQTVHEHAILGRGCQVCANRMLGKERISRKAKEFAKRSCKIHADMYDYSEAVYVGWQVPVKIICKRCGGAFMQVPNTHLSGGGCLNCNYKSGMDTRRLGIDRYRDRVAEVHGNSITVVEDSTYMNNHNYVGHSCEICKNVFRAWPANILSGRGCPQCAWKKRAEGRRLTHAEFVSASREVHGDRYDYSIDEYFASNQPLNILCNRCCEVFSQTPGSHRNGSGCPRCAESGFRSDKPAILYYLSLPLQGLYKIGITNRTVAQRYPGQSSIYTILAEWNFLKGGDARKIEQDIIASNADQLYDGPSVLRRVGVSEIFISDVLGLDFTVSNE